MVEDEIEDDSRDSRIMARLKDSLISQYTTQLKGSSSYIKPRLHQLSHSFHTPTHPPYALMIRRAIMELNDGSGSTEESIAEFVRREYEDLPWAHVKILGLHLNKLCQVGELACTEGGRYHVLPVDADGGEETERCKGKGTSSRKRKRGKRRRSSNRGNGERRGTVESVEIHNTSNGLLREEEIQGEQACDRSQSEKGHLEVVAEQTQRAQTQPNELLQDSQIQDSVPHLETICSPQLTALNLPVDSQQPSLIPISEGLSKCIPAAGMGLTQTNLQLQMSCHRPSESSLDAADKMLVSLSPLNVQEHKQNENPMSGDPEQQHPNHQCMERPCNSKPHGDNQGESLFPSGDAIVNQQKPNVKKTEKCWQSQPRGQGVGREMHSKLRRNAHDVSEQTQPEDQAQGPGIELSSPTQLQPQISSGIDLGVVSKTTALLTCVNVQDDKQPQHCNQGNPKGNIDENPMSGSLKQKIPKRPRGRPPKPKSEKGESLLPSDDDIHNKQRPNINNTKKQHGRGRGQGRPRKLNQDGEQSQQKDQAKRCGRGRGGGRPPKRNGNAEPTAAEATST